MPPLDTYALLAIGMLLVLLLVILVNLIILGLSFKLYTEILKDRSQDRRLEKKDTGR